MLSQILEAWNSNARGPHLFLVTALGCAGIALLRWLYVTLTQEKRPRLWAGVAPGWKGYRQGQIKYIFQGGDVLIDGIRKFGDSTVFWIPALLGAHMVLPTKYVAELKNHKDLNFFDYIEDAFPGTGLKERFLSGSFVKIVKKHLTRDLNQFTGVLSDETAEALDEMIPAKDDWTPVVMNTSIARIITRASVRVFAGEPLCRNERWLELALNFTLHISESGIKMRFVPRSLAPYIIRLLPSFRKAGKDSRDAERLIQEPAKQRRAEMAKAAADGVEFKKPNDGMQWSIDAGEPDSGLANYMLVLGALSVHTTTSTLMQMIYDLCSYPEFITPLREETRDIFGDGTIDPKADLAKLKKLDSFMKESMRLNPINHVAIQRKATKDIVLSDGLKIRRGEYVMVASTPVLRDERFYPNPDTFDAFRFYKLRQVAGRENSYQFVSSSETYFVFSQGEHICPGRFFASHLIKIVLIYLFHKYDFKYPEGQTKRPENMSFEENNFANQTQKILFRQRAV